MEQHSQAAVQWSLRELLVVVLVAGLGLASLRLGGVVGAITILLAIVLCMALGIVVFVGRREPQAFAIGFLVPVIVYAAIVLVAGRYELNPHIGVLPTTRAMSPIFESMVARTDVNIKTGQEVPELKAQDAIGATSQGGGMATVGLSELRDRKTFMLLAHTLMGLAFGYVGGKFAVFVYRRQRREPARPSVA